MVSFEKFNLPYHGTEFEVRDQERFKYTDEQRKLITEYMMILYFSHPNVEGFWHWTFADMNPNRPLDYTLFTYDGKPKSTGEKWIELMEGFLNTDEIITSTAKGKVDFKGYYGTYEATVKVNGKNYTGTFELASDAKQKKILVQLQLTN